MLKKEKKSKAPINWGINRAWILDFLNSYLVKMCILEEIVGSLLILVISFNMLL